VNIKVNPKSLTFKVATSIILGGAIEGAILSGVFALLALSGHGDALTWSDVAIVVAVVPLLRMTAWFQKRKGHIKSMQTGIDLGRMASRQGVTVYSFEDEFSTVKGSSSFVDPNESLRVPAPRPTVGTVTVGEEIRVPVAATMTTATVYNQVVASSLAALAADTEAAPVIKQ